MAAPASSTNGWRKALLTLGLVFFAQRACLAQAQGLSVEAAIKATYLYKIAAFVEWPADTFATPASPVVICVIGEDPFEGLLDRAILGQTIEQRPIELRRRRTTNGGSECHVAYIAGSGTQSVAQAIAELAVLPVVTVTDAARDPAIKGIVHFVLHQNRVRFEIDDFAAAQNGLSISSKLLSLAVAVRPRR